MAEARFKTDALNVGMVALVQGSLVDVRFTGHLPPINSLLHGHEVQIVNRTTCCRSRG